jgi:hypothetical protein
MDCREFQRIHPDLLDENLSPLEVVEAHRHMLECKSCANQDASVRRALLVFRNLQPIRPSAGFSDRLNRRLRAAQSARSSNTPRFPAFTTFAAVAGVLIMAAVADSFHPRHELTLPPATASLPEPQSSVLVSPTLAASMSAGLPVWPALLMAEHASQQLADAEFRFAAYAPR